MPISLITFQRAGNPIFLEKVKPLKRMPEWTAMNRIIKIEEQPLLKNSTFVGTFRMTAFDHFLPLFLEQAFAGSGEVYISAAEAGDIDGIYIYDPVELAGTCFTGSDEIARGFYSMNLGLEFFSERNFGKYSEIENINAMEFSSKTIELRITNTTQILDNHNLTEILGFMKKAYPKVNEDWVSSALRMGEKCFVCKFENKIAGMGWISIYSGYGRLHSLYVDPAYRRMSVGKDLVQSRMYFASMNGVRKLISEIPEGSLYSQKIASGSGFKLEGAIYNYKRMCV